MPQGLYDSVKQSVIEYTEIKKKNQRQEDKKIFKWKLLALGLSILLIVFVGAFSQLLKQLRNIPEVTSQSSYVVDLLGLPSIQIQSRLSHAKNIISGINAPSKISNIDNQWNRISQIYASKNQLNFTSIKKAIQNKQQLVFLFSSTTQTSKFGLRLHNKYNQKESQNGIIQTQPKQSSIFNYQKQAFLTFSKSNCNLYKGNTNSITLFESIIINNQNQIIIQDKSTCFKNNITVKDITGLVLDQIYTDITLQIYQLTLNTQL